MKNLRGSVLCRCAWYIRQPGSLRDSSVSLVNTPATSVSRPVFAIHVTASTIILHPRQDFSSLAGHRLHLCRKLIHKHRLLPAWTGRDHPDACSTLFRDEVQIFPRRLRKLPQFGDPLSRTPPSRQSLVN